MSVRRCFGLVAAVVYVGVLAAATAGTQCPVGDVGGCAKVHALMLRARPPVVIRALPMRAAREPGPHAVAPVRMASAR
jgi:hypothetical protein